MSNVIVFPGLLHNSRNAELRALQRNTNCSVRVAPGGHYVVLQQTRTHYSNIEGKR